MPQPLKGSGHRVAVGLSLDPVLLKWLRKHAKAAGMSVSDVANEVLVAGRKALTGG